MDGFAYSSMFDGIAKLALCGVVLLVVFVPLGLWKLVEIVIWLCDNVNITIGG